MSMRRSKSKLQTLALCQPVLMSHCTSRELPGGRHSVLNKMHKNANYTLRAPSQLVCGAFWTCPDVAFLITVSEHSLVLSEIREQQPPGKKL